MSLLSKFTKKAVLDPLKRSIDTFIDNKIENAVSDLFISTSVRDLASSSKNTLGSMLSDATKQGLADDFFKTSTSEINRVSQEDICNNFNPKGVETSTDAVGRIDRVLNVNDVMVKNDGRQQSLNAGGKLLQFPSSIGKYYLSMKFRKYTRTSPFEKAKLEFRNAISFPVPRNLKEDFSVNIDSSSTPGWKGVAADAALRAAADGGAGDLISTQTGAALFAAAVSKAGEYEGIIGSIAGAVPNPHVQAFFKGVNLREFSFEWTFAPRNPEESVKLQEIINTLKQNSLPTFSSNGGVAALQYPYLCVLDLHPWASQTPLIKFKPTLLKGVSVNYAPNGIPSFFAGTTLPTTIQIKLDFVETEYFTAEDFGRAPDEDGISKVADWLGEIVGSVSNEVTAALGGTPTENTATNPTAAGDAAAGQSATATRTANTVSVIQSPASKAPQSTNTIVQNQINALTPGSAPVVYEKTRRTSGVTTRYTVRKIASRSTINGKVFDPSTTPYVITTLGSTGSSSASGYPTATSTYNALVSGGAF